MRRFRTVSSDDGELMRWDVEAIFNESLLGLRAVQLLCEKRGATLVPRLDGDTRTCNLRHEDWGDGEIPTFDKHVTAKIGWNEMRCTTSADHMPSPPPRPGVVPGFSLQGPVPIEATAGNVWPE